MTTKIVRSMGRRAHRFHDLKHSQWYVGGETGKLYFYFESPDGKSRLYRMDDNSECTSRYQRAGTFIPVDVTVIVEACIKDMTSVERMMSTFGMPRDVAESIRDLHHPEAGPSSAMNVALWAARSEQNLKKVVPALSMMGLHDLATDMRGWIDQLETHLIEID